MTGGGHMKHMTLLINHEQADGSSRYTIYENRSNAVAAFCKAPKAEMHAVEVADAASEPGSIIHSFDMLLKTLKAFEVSIKKNEQPERCAKTFFLYFDTWLTAHEKLVKGQET